MATLSPRLEGLLDAWSAHPDVTPDQASQLRSLLVADRQQLDFLNQAAQAGQLRGFALAASGAEVYRAGGYDPVTGVMTLPRNCFQIASATPGGELKVVVALQIMVVRLAHSNYADDQGVPTPVTPVMVRNLQTVLNGSPVLTDEVKRSIQEGRLQRLAILDPRLGAGGTYSDADKSMNLSASSLEDPVPPKTFAEDRAGDLAFVMGHEIQHSFNYAERQEAWKSFQAQIEQIAKSRQPEHDYSKAVRELLQATRLDEARAEMAGWNALVSRTALKRPNPTLDDIYDLAPSRAADFVELGPDGNSMVSIPGFAFDRNHSLEATPANLEAIAKTYFDKRAAAFSGQGPATNLGFHHEADYTNYYGRDLVERILRAEHQYARPIDGEMPKLILDMDGLGLNRYLIERQGLSVPSGDRHEYYDSSQPWPKSIYFHHTQDGANDHQFVPPPVTAPAQASGLCPLSDPDHPQHALYADLKRLLPDHTSEMRLAQFTAACHQGGIKAGEIDAIQMRGTQATFLGGLAGYAQVDMAQRPSPEQSLQQLQLHERQQALAQQQALQQQGPQGPVMSR